MMFLESKWSKLTNAPSYLRGMFFTKWYRPLISTAKRFKSPLEADLLPSDVNMALAASTANGPKAALPTQAALIRSGLLWSALVLWVGRSMGKIKLLEIDS